MPTGKCGNGTSEQSINLSWANHHALLLKFVQNVDSEQFALAEIVFSLNVTDLPNGKNDTTIQLYHTVKTFDTPLHMSYHCTKIQTLNLVDSEKSNKTVAYLRLSHVQLEAYHKGGNAKFSTAKDCDAIDTPGKQHDANNKIFITLHSV